MLISQGLPQDIIAAKREIRFVLLDASASKLGELIVMHISKQFEIHATNRVISNI
jgi:hypothetical protein